MAEPKILELIRTSLQTFIFFYWNQCQPLFSHFVSMSCCNPDSLDFCPALFGDFSADEKSKFLSDRNRYVQADACSVWFIVEVDAGVVVPSSRSPAVGK